MRWPSLRRHLTLVVVLLATALPAVAATTERHAADAEVPRVTLIGDSVAAVLPSVPDALRILRAGIDLRLDVAVCRRLVEVSCPYRGSRPPNTLDVIGDTSQALGRIVVIDVGYNEPAATFPDAVARIMRELTGAGVEHVLWLTLTEARDGYAEINDHLRAARRQWPQLVVVDWQAASTGRSWFGDDGLHLNAEGGIGLARLVHDSVVEACGAACAPNPSNGSTRLIVDIDRLAAPPAFSIRLPEGWYVAAKRWREWKGVSGGSLGPAVVDGSQAASWRAGVILMPSGDGVRDVRRLALAVPGALDGAPGRAEIASEQFVATRSGRAWQLEERIASPGGDRRREANALWLVVDGGSARLVTGQPRRLVYAFRATCERPVCPTAMPALERIMRSLDVRR
jgi:hypothetical protein